MQISLLKLGRFGIVVSVFLVELVKMLVDAESQYLKNKELKKEDVLKLMEWQRLQPHLPKIDEFQTILFLHSCYYKSEATKKCIDNYFTARKLCPEFFSKRNPANPDIQNTLKTVAMCPLPKFTPEGYCILYYRLIDVNPDSYNFNVLIKVFDMATSLHLQQNGATDGHVIIVDLYGCSLSHVLKMGLVSIKKYMFFLQEALPVRLKGLHYANAVPFMDKVLGLFKPFMKKELLDSLQVHSGNNETLFKMIPKEFLPNEIGGSCGSVLEIHEAFCKEMLANADYFIEDEKLVADESLRPGKPKNAGDLFGVEGTFKKLDID